MTLGPLVSVVVATRNRPGRLRTLLDSLSRQTLATDAFEVVVVDDASTDETRACLRGEQSRRDLRLHTIERPRSEGPAVAREEGWRLARAPLIAFTDDDCEASPSWLEQGLATYRRFVGDPVQGRTEPLPRELHRAGPFTRTVQVREPGPFYQTCNMFYPRELLAELGGFDPSYTNPGGEDTDLAWRAREAGREIRYSPEALVYHAVEQLGPLGLLRVALRWSDAMQVFGRHPELRRRVLWRGIAWKRSHVLLLEAAVGLLAAIRLKPAALLGLPYALHLVDRCRAVGAHPALAPYFALHDALETYATLRGAVRHRVLVI